MEAKYQVGQLLKTVDNLNNTVYEVTGHTPGSNYEYVDVLYQTRAHVEGLKIPLHKLLFEYEVRPLTEEETFLFKLRK